jgi:protein-disulfide isomerase/uncharacterized membrane protein
LGIALAADLTGKHFQLKYQPQLDFDSICEVSATVSCAKVNASPWSEIGLGAGRPGLPVAVPAVGFYAMVGLLAAWALRGGGDRRRRALALVAGAALPALAFSLYLLAVQAFALRAWCLFCLALDATTLATLGVALIAHGGGLRGVLSDLKAPEVNALASALVVMLGVSGVSYGSYASRARATEQAGGTPKLAQDGAAGAAASSSPPSPAPGSGTAAGGNGSANGGGGASDNGDASAGGSGDGAPSAEDEKKALEEARKAIAELLDGWNAVEAREIPVNPFDAQKGNPNSPIVVVEFADFECPHCKLAAWLMQDVVARYGSQVHFVFKHYPLSKDCNSGMTRDLHPDACRAAVAAQCAARQGKFWPAHDHLFDNQGNLGRKTLLRIAGKIGIEPADLESCIDEDAPWDEVKAQVAQGRSLGLEGTPAFFVNGKALPSPHPLFVEAVLRRELRDRGVASLPEDPDGLFPPG